MKPLAPNTLLQNRYLIVQLIGKGGMGEVYLAVDQRLGSAMALKRTFFNDDELLRAAFEREAKTLARLRHPVLPKVSDHFEENEVQYLVMEHISGDDLSKRLEASKQPFPLSWVLFWGDQLLDALAYLHSQEPPIIHRDIKPQNLKLTNDNHIILLDFGLAKNSIGETRLTTSGTLSGYTPHYASMEQIRGTGTTAQSDIYSLSATIYQLLTNTVPPDALSRADSVLNNLPDPVKPLYEANLEVSPQISDVVLKGMSLSADKRYRDAREMQTALREAYAQMQQSMSAQTVAFNNADLTGKPQTGSLPSSQMMTEQYSTPLVSQPQKVTPQQVPVDDDFSTQATTPDIQIPPEIRNSYIPPVQEQNFNAPVKQEPDFNATMKYDGPVEKFNQPVSEKNEVFPNNPPPIGEKTEVLPPNIVTPPPPPNNFDDDIFPSVSNQIVDHNQTAANQIDPFNRNQSDPFKVADSQNDSFKETSGDFSAGTTIPLVSFNDDFVAEQPSNQTQQINNFVSDVPQDFPQTDMRTETLPREDAVAPMTKEVETPPPPVNKPPKKKGGGKALLIVGLIFAFLIIGLGAAGIGLYLAKPELFPDIFGQPTPTPTPIPTPTTEPTVEPTTTPTTEPTITPTVSPTVEPTLSPTVSPTTEPTIQQSTPDKTPRPNDKTPRPTPDKTPRPTPDKTPKPTPPQSTPVPTPRRTPV